MAYNRLRTMRDNIETIRLVLRLGVAGRTAQNAEERETLRKYAGFGGLKCILNEANDLEDAAKWSKADIELFAPTVELRRLIHDYSKDDKEFARYMDSLKASVLTAFYTPAPVIDSISGSLKQAGIEVRSFLEPSAGQGAFIDSFLRNDMYPGTEVLAYEKDLLTGKILSALHPSILTRIEGFEKIERDFEGYFDVAASNIPFGNFAVPDPAYAVSKDIPYRQASKAIHNYFFLKALDSVREGGLVAFIASQGVMNAASPFVRLEMMKRAAIARAIALNPKYLFCEEPKSGLDPKTSLIIDDLIHDITAEYKMTTIINTHDMNSVMNIGENIIFIKEGVKEWQGNSKEVITSKNKALNDFIFASDLFRKVKEVEEEELKEEELKAK